MDEADQGQVACPNKECEMYGIRGEWNILRRGYKWLCDACGHHFHAEKAATSRLPERAYKALRRMPVCGTLGATAKEVGVSHETMGIWAWVARSHWEKVSEALTEHGVGEEERERIRAFVSVRRPSRFSGWAT